MNPQPVVKYITNWLSEYSKNANSNGFVIGISGGIDSAVTSMLGAETGLPVLCLEMPIYQDKKQITRAQNHIAFLKNKYPNVSTINTDLTPVFDAFLKAFPKVEKEEKRLMSLVNTRARLRMTSLYYFAALNNQLVLGTGNKIEDFGVGFYTKYGDGGVDISPIADLTKTEVYELGRELGIANEIMTAPPTDGLWGDNRTDEEQIGATYPELEWAMKTLESNNIDELNFTDRQKEIINIYNKLNKSNQHKMQPIPVCNISKELKK